MQKCAKSEHQIISNQFMLLHCLAFILLAISALFCMIQQAFFYEDAKPQTILDILNVVFLSLSQFVVLIILIQLTSQLDNKKLQKDRSKLNEDENTEQNSIYVTNTTLSFENKHD